MGRKYNTLREKISADKTAREERYTLFARVWREAWEAGKQAALRHKPRSMIVMDSNGTPIERVDEGLCGFAWLNVPGNTSFGKWLRKRDMARPDYPTGLSVWISDYGQSYERKKVHAQVMSGVLSHYGIECRARSRLD